MKPTCRRFSWIIPTALCVIVAALWATSRHEARVLLVRSFGGHALAIASGNGGLLFFDGKANFEGVVTPAGELRSFGVAAVASADLHNFVEALLDQSGTKMARAGIRLAAGPKTPGAFPGLDGFVAVTLPYWLVLLALAPGVLLPVRRRVIRRRRKRKGLCQSCGYDLRMSEGRCPECGTGNEPLAASQVAGRE
jgi:hypothetical protein